MTTARNDANAHPAGTPRPASERGRALTEQVVASFEDSASPRYREVMQALVRHLHSFAAEVGLTEGEWLTGIGFLTRTGQLSDERRQEFILLSDVLGLSMLTVGLNESTDPAVTDSTVFGPFFVAGSPEVPLGGDLAAGAPGQPCWVEVTVRATTGDPVVGARVEVWESDEDGLYDVQHDDRRTAGRGHLFTDETGGVRFWSVRPAAYPIPADGPVGDLLAAAGRGPMRPAHIHFMLSAPGHRTLTTHVFAAGDPYLTKDAVFGVRASLVANFVEHPPGAAPPGGPSDAPWSSLTYDFVIATEPPERAHLPQSATRSSTA